MFLAQANNCKALYLYISTNAVEPAFAYLFQAADEAMQMHVHKTTYILFTPQRECLILWQQSQKCSSLAAMLLFHTV